MSHHNKEIVKKLKSILNGRNKFKIVNMTGSFLSGKTSLIQSLISDIDFINNYNVYSYVNDWAKYNYLFDITSDFFENSNLQHPEFLFDESRYFVQSFFDNLSTLNISNKELFKDINEYLLLESDSELGDTLKEKINSNIKNELKKKLILNYYEISIECLIADLLNNFFPLNKNIDSLSKYLLTKEPIKLLLIFDDAQSISKKIRNWFDMLFEYLHKKQLGDLLLYDYKGKDSEIYLGEFFHIDVLFISRDKTLEISGNDILIENLFKDYESIKELEYNDKENIDEKLLSEYPICNIPALAKFYTQLDSEKINNTAIFATNHLLKYIPEQFQRAIIFVSIFNEFTVKDFNLFEEVDIDEIEFEKIIGIADFILVADKQYKFEEKSKSILTGVSKLIFEEFNESIYQDISVKINNEYNSINLDEFDFIRELAYYKKFDKLFLIENVFNNSKSYSNIIDKHQALFEKNKSFYSLKQKHLELLMEYNRLRDKNYIDDKIKKIEEYEYKYQKEIEKRNKLLQEDVLSVGNEIKLINSEKLHMETHSDELAKRVIILKNELNDIEGKLKPFVHHNSRRKSTLNIIALIATVAIVFNSDRISELFFSTTSNFDYIIIFTLLLLLGLYGNGLMRNFRMKFKSEEYHIILQNKKNKENEHNQIQKELEILNADIRAKNSKIDDLKKHIERMNIQIFENKLKLEN